MRADQRAFQEAVQIAQQIEPVLESAGLAFIAIDRHQPRAGLAEHRAPFAAGGKAGAAEPAQAGSVERLQDVFRADPAGAQIVEQLVTAILHIGVVVDIGRDIGFSLAARGRCQDFGRGRAHHVVMTDLGHRGHIAQADAGRAHHADAGTGTVLQFLQQLLRALHRAGERIADADGERRDVGLAFLHHVEMRVEGRGLEHFGERKLHLVRKGGEMGGGNLVIFVLDQMQMFDQEIAPPRPVAEQKFNFVRGRRIDLAPLGRGLGAPPARSRMLECAHGLNVVIHENVSILPCCCKV